MTAIHFCLFGIFMAICVLTVMGLSTYHTPMLKYDESEVYACPYDLQDSYQQIAGPSWDPDEILVEDEEGVTHSINDQVGSRLTEDPFTHQSDYDFFYDPLDCNPFYQNHGWEENPIWFGRVKNLKKENQHLIIYGFVTTDNPNAESILDKEIEIKFDIHVRGKNKGVEEWTSHTPRHEVSLKAVCSKDDHLCTYFPAGFVPFIQYTMYDVAIVIHPTETLDSLAATSLDFHIAYFNE